MLINRILSVAAMALCFVGFLQSAISYKLNKDIYKKLIPCFVTMFLYSASLSVILFLGGDQNITYHYIVLAACFCMYVFAILLIYYLTMYIISLVMPNYDKKFSVFTKAIVIFDIIIIIITQFTGFYYTIDESNHYIRGDGYVLASVLYYILILSVVPALIKQRKLIARKELGLISAWLFASGLAFVLQYIFKQLEFLVFFMVFFVLLMYIYTATVQMEIYNEQNRQNDKLKTDLMLSQIQPHFIFNSLTAIKQLCKENPPLAVKAISDFSLYLRGNIDFHSEEKTILFHDELKHTKAYLSMEELRFEDDLNVVYMIEAEDFNIPPLTLQPIVENSVRHGIREKPDGKGNITIASRELSDKYEISVIDDGIGFDIKKIDTDNKKHVGIYNVRERLNDICGGKLVIDSSPGNGTQAVISIPKKQHKRI